MKRDISVATVGLGLMARCTVGVTGAREDVSVPAGATAGAEGAGA